MTQNENGQLPLTLTSALPSSPTTEPSKKGNLRVSLRLEEKPLKDWLDSLPPGSTVKSVRKSKGEGK